MTRVYFYTGSLVEEDGSNSLKATIFSLFMGGGLRYVNKELLVARDYLFTSDPHIHSRQIND